MRQELDKKFDAGAGKHRPWRRSVVRLRSVAPLMEWVTSSNRDH